MSIQRIGSIIAAIIFLVMFITMSGFVPKSLALGFLAIAIIWAATGWTTSIYASGSNSGGSVQVEEGGAQFNVGSLWAGLIVAACLGGGFLIMFLLSQIAAVNAWIG